MAIDSCNMFRIVGLLLLCNFLNICCGNSENLFSCYNGKRIKLTFKCDYYDDCGDGSDELDCYRGYPSYCSKNDYRCKNNNCISRDTFCDGYSDCTDNSDEYDGCEEELKCKDQFRCTNGYCLAKESVCDGMNDCFDGSDERNCIAIGCKTENHRYLCENKKCISLDYVCDGNIDCSDASDEGDACEDNTRSCLSITCSHKCIMTPDGPVCICPEGYGLQNSTRCTNIDECTKPGICDQQCANIKGSYRCICQEGYTLQGDMKTCKADGGEATIIFSTDSNIQGMYLDSKIEFVVAKGVNRAVGVAIDGEYIYWSENDETIVKGTKDGKRKIILTTGLHKLSDIAVDWITGNIYFTDEDGMHIGVCDNNGTYCTILISKETKKPTGLALLPIKGMMYWCDASHEPYIAMAGMDGNDIILFVTKKLKYPNSLTIDYPNNRLYWMDTDLTIIESIRLDGTDREIISREITLDSKSLTIFENKLYWLRGDIQDIYYRNVFAGRNLKVQDHISGNIHDMQIYHPAIKSKIPNACFSNPCSQLCLLNKNSNYTCACTLDKKLSSDEHTCQDTKKGQHIIIFADGTFIDYYHELLGKPKITTSVTLKHITAITYDSLSGTILASNAITDKIFRYNPISGEINNIISMDIKSLGGMAFDHIGNNLYLTNIEEETIEVHSLMTKAKKIFYLGERPYDIALAPEEGIMFIVFKENDKYRIDKMQMNGLGTRSLFVESNLLSGPNVSLYYDMDKRKIFWSDQVAGCIESASLTGFDYQLFRTKLNKPISLAIAGEYIFWTERQSNQLFWADKNNIHQNNKNFVVYLSEEVEISYLVASHRIVVQNEYGCRKNNGNCSHVCLPMSVTSYLCACPPQMTLSANNHTCVWQHACSPGEIKCSEHDICIKWKQWCNGIKECPNGEDEPSNCEKKDETKNSDCKYQLPEGIDFFVRP